MSAPSLRAEGTGSPVPAELASAAGRLARRDRAPEEDGVVAEVLPLPKFEQNCPGGVSPFVCSIFDV